MNHVADKAIKGFSILFMIKIISRASDFILNIIILRDLESEIIGRKLK
jgi:hypothetical protein